MEYIFWYKFHINFSNLIIYINFIGRKFLGADPYHCNGLGSSIEISVDYCVRLVIFSHQVAAESVVVS